MENPTNAEGKKITGLGTPATRASIIASLIKRDYINKSKKNIGITDKGKFIITTCLKDSNLSDFMSIETTTLWEQKLSDNPIEFLNSIKGFLTNCIQSSNLQVGNYKDSSLGNCPVCQKEIRKGEKNYYCSGYKEGCTFTILKRDYPKLKYTFKSSSTQKLSEYFNINASTIYNIKVIYYYGSEELLNKWLTGNWSTAYAVKEAENNRKEEKETIIKVLEDKSH